jgi:hypothetical protein
MSLSILVYLCLLPISFFNFQKIKKIKNEKNLEDSDNLEDIL